MINLDALISESVPSNLAAFFDSFTCLIGLAQVVEQLRQVSEELCVSQIGLVVLPGMGINLIGLLHGITDLTTFDKDHEVNLFKFANEELVFDSHAFEFSDGDCVSDILDTVLREQDREDLDFGPQPEQHVWMLSTDLGLYLETGSLCFNLLLLLASFFFSCRQFFSLSIIFSFASSCLTSRSLARRSRLLPSCWSTTCSCKVGSTVDLRQLKYAFI